MISPNRQPTDGTAGVARVDGDHLKIAVTTADEMQVIVCSEFNAMRVFGMLAMMLDITLPHAIQKRIQL